MNLQRIAQAVAVALLATACTGGGDDPEQSAASDTVAVETTTTFGPRNAGGDAFDTAAPTTSTTTIAAPAPNSLAFASARDVGRLFEVAGSGALFDGPAGDATGTISNGSLVQATSARSRDGGLWVRIRESGGELADLGWVEANSLEPTSQSVIVEKSQFSGELRVSRRSGDPMPLFAQPGSNQVGELAPQEVAMHGGGEALSASGELWLDVIDSSSRARLGWVKRDAFLGLSSNLIQNGNHESVRTRPDSTVTYGASLPQGLVTVDGCNAQRIAFTNTSTSSGLAFVVGKETPIGRVRGSTELWSATSGTRVFAAPGEQVILTLRSEQASSWYFAGLDADFHAEAPRNADGSLADSGSGVQATNVQRFDIGSGSCADRERRGNNWGPEVDENPLSATSEAPEVEEPAEDVTAPTTTEDESEEGDGSASDSTADTTTVPPSSESTVAPESSIADDAADSPDGSGAPSS